MVTLTDGPSGARVRVKIDTRNPSKNVVWFQKNAAKPSKKCNHSLQNHQRFNIHYLILGTAFGKEIDPSNPWNMTGKQFDAEKSSVLAAVMDDTTRVNKNHNIA